MEITEKRRQDEKENHDNCAKYGTAVKTEKTTKETKKKEKIEIKILSKYDQIKKLLSKYPKEMTSEEASDQEIVVIENESFDKASKKIWDQFLKM